MPREDHGMYFPHPSNGEPAAPDRFVKFRYVNWNGDPHEYIIKVLSVEFGPYDDGGGTPRPVSMYGWVLHGDVVTRDGDPRPEMGPTRRRTFLIRKIHEMELIDEPS